MDTQYNPQDTMDALSQLQFHGNIIPHTWYKHITFDNGKPDLLAIMLLSEIIYWYRPTAVKSEKTGELIGYRKKFREDKLQRGIGSFATQFGVSKRQASEALKRLEDYGLITRELRTINTSMGKIGNVLFIAPVVEGIKKIQSGVPLMQSNVIGGDPDDDPEDDERTPLCNQTHKGEHSNVGGSAFERGTYTKSTTQITTKITAAATEPQSSQEVPISAAAAPDNFKSPITHQAACDNTQGADSLIGATLTETQLDKIKATAQEVTGAMPMENSARLFDEICHGLLEARCFSKTGNNFHRKLNAIKNSIRNSSWETPATLLEEKQDLHHEKVQLLQEKLSKAHSLINYCNQMLEFYSKDNLQAERLNTVKAEKAKYEAEFSELKGQLSASLHSHQYRSRLDGGETTFTQNHSASTSAANRL